MMLQAVGAATDPASGGRQMPTHWSSRALNIVSTSSSTTTQLLHAVGCAEAGRYFSRHPEAAAKAEGDYRAFRDVTFHGDEVVFTHRWARVPPPKASSGRRSIPLPIRSCRWFSASRTTATPSALRSRSIRREATSPGWWPTSPTFHFAEVDGTDAEASVRAFEASVAHCRAGRGPAFVHGHCVRPYSHSLSDDDRLYRSKLPSARPTPCVIRWSSCGRVCCARTS
jgi:2-oxoisovalerate dehydrogenase E1 component